MMPFIELNVTEEEEFKTILVNTASIGRVYPNPQSSNKSIVELNYQGSNDVPVYLEVDTPYEKLRISFLS
jgi:hypothetical protein